MTARMMLREFGKIPHRIFYMIAVGIVLRTFKLPILV